MSDECLPQCTAPGFESGMLNCGERGGAGAGAEQAHLHMNCLAESHSLSVEQWADRGLGAFVNL